MTTTTRANNVFIGGSWKPGDGQPLEITPPWTCEKAWTGRGASVAQVEDAFRAASAAFHKWSDLSVDDRIAILTEFTKRVESQSDDLARSISQSCGKPLWEAMTETRGIVGKLRPSIAALFDRASELRPDDGGHARTYFRPHGVVGVIGPFNFPVHMPNVHIMPALLAGNCVVFKPSELVPAPAEIYTRLLAEAGIPPGVFNLIQGDGTVGEAIVTHPDCRAICFTGSVPVGRQIEEHGLRRRALVAVEMGGNSPLVVWDSAEIDAAILIAIQSCFVTAGQRCSSARRVVIPSGPFGTDFLNGLIEAARRISFGLPFDDPQPFYGPLITSDAATRAMKWQEQLEQLGGTVLLRSERSDRCESLVGPGIIDVTSVDQGLIPDEELMCPIVTVRRCESFDAAIAECNASRFGLAAGLVSEDQGKYERFVRTVEAGVFSWNVPLTGSSAWAAFGGVKDSGNSRPTGYFSADYVARPIGASESPKAKLPASLPPGIAL